MNTNIPHYEGVLKLMANLGITIDDLVYFHQIKSLYVEQWNEGQEGRSIKLKHHIEEWAETQAEDSDQFYLDRDNMLKLAKTLKIPLGPLKRHPIIFFDL